MLYSYIFCFRVEGLVKLLLLSDLYYCCLMILEWPLWSVGLFFSPRAICRRLCPLAIHFFHQNMLYRYFKDDPKQMLMIKKKKSYYVLCTCQSLMLDPKILFQWQNKWTINEILCYETKMLEKKNPRINSPHFRGKENRGTLSVYRVVICSSLRRRVHDDNFLLFRILKSYYSTVIHYYMNKFYLLIVERFGGSKKDLHNYHLK